MNARSPVEQGAATREAALAAFASSLDLSAVPPAVVLRAQ